LSLTKFSFPLPAIASITHRITGVLLFAAIAYLLWLLSVALESPSGFDRAQAILDAPLPKLVMLATLAALLFHFLAGIKHLIMDFHVGDSFEAGRRSSQVVFVLTVVGTVLAGVWIW
jgi:succinate dehydrogenase / fumarate reductase cytochrome b subunit